MKWFDLICGLSGLFYLFPPYKPFNLGCVLVCLGFLVKFVLGNVYGR